MEYGVRRPGSGYEYGGGIAVQKIFVRLLLFALAFTALHFIYVLHDGSSCTGGSTCFNGQIHHGFISLGSSFSAYQEGTHLQLRKALNFNLNKLWTTKGKVDSFSFLLSDLLKRGMLHEGDKGLSMLAGEGHEAVALQEIGINSRGIDMVSSPSLASTIHKIPFEDGLFDFELANFSDFALFSEAVRLEMERSLKPGGFFILQISGELTEDSDVNNTSDINRFSGLFKNSDVVHVKEIGGSGHVVLKKRLRRGNELADAQSGECIVTSKKKKIINEAESLIMDEPLKPWITLKENAKKIKYLPSVVDITDNHNFIYVDVGARSYRSSIGSWFVKRYPKQGQDFSIYAFEADAFFASDYAKRKNVHFLPYAAWLRNESLVFGANPENRASEGEIGMGRIQRLAELKKMEVGSFSKQFKTVQGLDFADWLVRTATPDDFVMMKMDIEGAEFDLLPRMMETGAICLVDELFLECHYNRWQRSSPFRTSKYGTTYEDCVSLFETLRKRGVLVHQWW